MEIKVIEPFMANGNRVEVGEVIDLPVAEAAYVVGLKRAEHIDGDIPPAKSARAKKTKAE